MVSMLQVVVQGIPWKFEWKDLKDLFQEHNPAFAEVVMNKDGRSRVRCSLHVNVVLCALLLTHTCICDRCSSLSVSSVLDSA